MSNTRSVRGGIDGGRPLAPYAIAYGTNRRRLPPTCMATSPFSHPAITLPAPNSNAIGGGICPLGNGVRDDSNARPSASVPS